MIRFSHRCNFMILLFASLLALPGCTQKIPTNIGTTTTVGLPESQPPVLTKAIADPTLDAADWTKVDRKIGREPAYKNKPLYCLVVFGPELRPRIWLVLDGDILYVDRNGNGDLTEVGKPLEDHETAQFPKVEIEGADHVKRELDLFIYDWRPGQAARPDENGPSLTIRDQGNRTYGAWGDHESAVIWSSHPETAPILHVGGPLQMGFEVRAKYAFRQKTADTFELSVGVGTKGFGNGSFVHLKYWNGAIPDQLQPTARLEFSNKTPGGPPVRLDVTLQHRC
jgi:hypothetical protein